MQVTAAEGLIDRRCELSRGWGRPTQRRHRILSRNQNPADLRRDAGAVLAQRLERLLAVGQARFVVFLHHRDAAAALLELPEHVDAAGSVRERLASLEQLGGLGLPGHAAGHAREPGFGAECITRVLGTPESSASRT